MTGMEFIARVGVVVLTAQLFSTEWTFFKILNFSKLETAIHIWLLGSGVVFVLIFSIGSHIVIHRFLILTCLRF